MSDNMTTELHIDILGRIWMPIVEAATSMRLNQAELERAHVDPFNLDDVERYIDTNTGDFSSIIAFQATVVQRKGYPSRKDGDWTVISYGMKDMALKEFTEEEQIKFDECMYGRDDELDECASN